MKVMPGEMVPGEMARLRAGYTLKQAAQRIRISRRTKLESVMRRLRRAELHGGASDMLCEQLAVLYGCSTDLFFFPPEYWRAWEKTTGRSVDELMGRSNVTSTVTGKAQGTALRRKTLPARSSIYAGMLSKPSRGVDSLNAQVRNHLSLQRAARRLLQI
jgi:hypothetical protein